MEIKEVNLGEIIKIGNKREIEEIKDVVKVNKVRKVVEEEKKEEIKRNKEEKEGRGIVEPEHEKTQSQRIFESLFHETYQENLDEDFLCRSVHYGLR